MCLKNNFFGSFLLRLSLIKPSQVIFMVKFSPTAHNIGYDFVLLVHFFGDTLYMVSYDRFVSFLFFTQSAVATPHLGHKLQRPFNYWRTGFSFMKRPSNQDSANTISHILIATYTYINLKYLFVYMRWKGNWFLN